MLGPLQDAGNTTTLARYLELLGNAGLAAGLSRYPRAGRGSSPKLNVLDPAIMTAMLGYAPDEAKADKTLWGRVVESAVGAHLHNTLPPATTLHCWRHGNREVDFVLARGPSVLGLEVKSGRTHGTLKGLRAFKERFPKSRTLLVGGDGVPPRRIPVGDGVLLAGRGIDVIVPRTVTTVEPDASPGSKLSDFRDERFYVLLGSPGAGKTTAFKAEARHVDDSLYLTAREVVRSHAHPRSEWRGKTLFIDGLDEVRAGEQDVRKPLACILDCLYGLDGPRARLSCRSAAWLTTSDIEAISSVPGYERLWVLQLDPLTAGDVREILDHRLGKAADGFFEAAHSRRLHGLLDNPLSLEMLVKAMGKGNEWPESRVETFEQACLALATELNDEHRTADRYGPPARPLRSPRRGQSHSCTVPARGQGRDRVGRLRCRRSGQRAADQQDLRLRPPLDEAGMGIGSLCAATVDARLAPRAACAGRRG